MRCVSFLLTILAVVGTSSVRGQQPELREAIRDAARDPAIAKKESAGGERREAREERRDDRQEGREERRDERREGREDRDRGSLWAAIREAIRDGESGDRGAI